MNNPSKGVTLAEIIIVIAIILILSGLAVGYWISARKTVEISVLADEVAAKLEQAKNSASSGKGGQSYGIKFASTSYTLFTGTYDPATTSNQVSNISGYYFSTTLPSDMVRFARLTGAPQANGTIKIVDSNDPARFWSISIGNFGDIRVIK